MLSGGGNAAMINMVALAMDSVVNEVISNVKNYCH